MLQSVYEDPGGNLVRDNEARIHNLLIPFDNLSAEDQKKDVDSILNLSTTVDLVEFEIGLFEDLTL